MIELKINGIDITENLTETYSISRKTEIKDRFENYDGTTAAFGIKYKTTISADAEELPDETAEKLSAALKSGGEIDVEYTSPEQSSGKFICTDYSAEADSPGFDGSPPIWNIHMVLEETSSEANGSGDGL